MFRTPRKSDQNLGETKNRAQSVRTEEGRSEILQEPSKTDQNLSELSDIEQNPAERNKIDRKPQDQSASIRIFQKHANPSSIPLLKTKYFRIVEKLMEIE